MMITATLKIDPLAMIPGMAEWDNTISHQKVIIAVNHKLTELVRNRPEFEKVSFFTQPGTFKWWLTWKFQGYEEETFCVYDRDKDKTFGQVREMLPPGIVTILRALAMSKIEM